MKNNEYITKKDLNVYFIDKLHKVFNYLISFIMGFILIFSIYKIGQLSVNLGKNKFDTCSETKHHYQNKGFLIDEYDNYCTYTYGDFN